MKSEIIITYLNNEQTILKEANIELNTINYIALAFIISKNGHRYSLNLNNIKSITIKPYHKKQSKLPIALDDIALTTGIPL